MQYEESKLIQKFMSESSIQFMSLEELKQGLIDRKFSVESNGDSLLVNLNGRYFTIEVDDQYPNSFQMMEIDEDGNDLIDKEDAPLIYRDGEAILMIAQVLKMCSRSQNLILALELAQQRNPRTEKY